MGTPVEYLRYPRLLPRKKVVGTCSEVPIGKGAKERQELQRVEATVRQLESGARFLRSIGALSPTGSAMFRPTKQPSRG